jgi:DNA-binding transcriptional LysR family regulator
MNWDTVTFDWNQARAFLATAEEGSLSAASRALGQTQPTLGRQVAALEDALGVLLFERIGKSLVLTPTGRDLVEHVRTMYEAANRISLTASSRSQAVEGKVRITASDVMAALLLPPAIRELRRTAPLLDVEIIAANEVQNLQQREADIAIRHVRPEQPELIAKLIGEASAYFYASREYLEKRGTPHSFAELADHDWISFANDGMLINSLAPLGIKLTQDNFRAGSANGLVAWDLAKQGIGIVIMPPEVTEMAPEMVQLVPDMAPLNFPVWLTTHKELHTSRRIRITFDLLADFLVNRMKLST